MSRERYVKDVMKPYTFRASSGSIQNPVILSKSRFAPTAGSISIIRLGGKQVHIHTDMKITFVDGRVTDVKT